MGFFGGLTEVRAPGISAKWADFGGKSGFFGQSDGDRGDMSFCKMGAFWGENGIFWRFIPRTSKKKPLTGPGGERGT